MLLNKGVSLLPVVITSCPTLHQAVRSFWFCLIDENLFPYTAQFFFSINTSHLSIRYPSAFILFRVREIFRHIDKSLSYNFLKQCY